MSKRTITMPTTLGGQDLTERTLSRRTISIPRAPWEDADPGHDPRHETNPRFTLIKSERRGGPDVAAVIKAIRREHAARGQA